MKYVVKDFLGYACFEGKEFDSIEEGYVYLAKMYHEPHKDSVWWKPDWFADYCVDYASQH